MLLGDIRTKAVYYFDNSSYPSMLRVLLSDGTSAVVIFRLAKFFQKIKLGLVGWFLSGLNKILNGCVIGRHAEFDSGFVLMHPIGVVINGKVVGGRNIVIESGVVLGTAHSGIPVHAPVFGDNVFIGAGAKVLGGIKIGSNVKIGANAVVVKDVPDNVTVVGVPAVVIG